MGKPLLGAGVYDAREVSHLLAEPVERIARWSAPDSHHRPAVVSPSWDRLFSFRDLVSLSVASELHRRGVTDSDMRTAIEYLEAETRHDKPLAHRDVTARLATSGAALLLDVDGSWYDLGKGGHGTFRDVVQLYLRRLDYDQSGVARRWRPAPMVLLDPEVQAGAPCVEGTRVPTQVVAALLEGDQPEVVADDLELTLEQVKAAAEFESRLQAGGRIAA